MKFPFCQYVCELVFGINLFDLDFGIQTDSIEQPIKSNSVGPGNMSHCRASSLYDHHDHCFVVLKEKTTKLPYEKNTRLRKQDQHYSDHQSFQEFSFALEICTGLPVLDHSDTDDHIP